MKDYTTLLLKASTKEASNKYLCAMMMQHTSLAWPDLSCTAACLSIGSYYPLEVISATPQGSGVVHEHKNFQHVIGVNYLVG